MGAEQVPGDGTRGQSELTVQEIELSSVQSPQEAETGGLDGGGVGSTGRGVYQRIAYHHLLKVERNE